jgi:hypothetical protein
MAGLNLARGSAPAEVQGIGDPDIERKMKAWAKEWPKVEAAYAEMKKALEALLGRTSATHDAVNRRIG